MTPGCTLETKGTSRLVLEIDHVDAEVEIFAITPRIAERYAHRAVDYHGLDQRTCYKVTTSSGVVGWGESRGSPELKGKGYGVYGPSADAYNLRHDCI